MRVLFFLLLTTLYSCVNPEKQKDPGHLKNTSLKYAKRFAILNEKDHTRICLFGNRDNFDTTDVFILNENSAGKAESDTIKIPCKKIAALSCIYSTMLNELGATENLIAIDNIDYVNNTEIISRFNKGAIKQIATGPEVDVEAAISLAPDVVFTFGMGDGPGNNLLRLRSAGIPVAIALDHLEESPLARAEWIKFFAAFVGKSAQADSIFDAVEKRYFEIRQIASTSNNKPSVFSEIKYGDVWYMPGGRSFMATLIRDAAGNYLWSDNDQTGSLQLSFEQVYTRAKDADYWINQPMIYSREDLLAADKRYSAFGAFQKEKLYNNTKVRNAKGYSNYWESGMIHPERILSDLVLILHPELKSKIGTEVYYYEQLH